MTFFTGRAPTQQFYFFKFCICGVVKDIFKTPKSCFYNNYILNELSNFRRRLFYRSFLQMARLPIHYHIVIQKGSYLDWNSTNHMRKQRSWKSQIPSQPMKRLNGRCTFPPGSQLDVRIRKCKLWPLMKWNPRNWKRYMEFFPFFLSIFTTRRFLVISRTSEMNKEKIKTKSLEAVRGSTFPTKIY